MLTTIAYNTRVKHFGYNSQNRDVSTQNCSERVCHPIFRPLILQLGANYLKTQTKEIKQLPSSTRPPHYTKCPDISRVGYFWLHFGYGV